MRRSLGAVPSAGILRAGIAASGTAAVAVKRVYRDGLGHQLMVGLRVNLFVVLPVTLMLTLVSGTWDWEKAGKYLLVVLIFTNCNFLLLNAFYHWVWLRTRLHGRGSYAVLGLLVLPAIGALGTFVGQQVLGLAAPGLLRMELEKMIVVGMVVTIVYGLGFFALEDGRRSRRSSEQSLAVLRGREGEVTDARDRAEIVALQALIKPHFIFNALNAVATLIPDEPEKAEETTLRLARLLRYILEIQDGQMVSLEREMAIVKAYLEIEKIRQGDRLTFQLSIPDELGKTPFPGMILQPLVENAVVHGVRQRETPGYVRVDARHDNGYCVVRVIDNGPGFSTHKGTGKAMNLVRERLNRLYGNRHELILGRDAEKGETLVELRIPEASTGGASV